MWKRSATESNAVKQDELTAKQCNQFHLKECYLIEKKNGKERATKKRGDECAWFGKWPTTMCEVCVCVCAAGRPPETLNYTLHVYYLPSKLQWWHRNKFLFCYWLLMFGSRNRHHHHHQHHTCEHCRSMGINNNMALEIDHRLCLVPCGNSIFIILNCVYMWNPMRSRSPRWDREVVRMCAGREQ